MSSINADTGETTSSRSPRFSHWCAFLVFSTISLVAAVEEVGNESEGMIYAQRIVA